MPVIHVRKKVQQFDAVQVVDRTNPPTGVVTAQFTMPGTTINEWFVRVRNLDGSGSLVFGREKINDGDWILRFLPTNEVLRVDEFTFQQNFEVDPDRP